MISYSLLFSDKFYVKDADLLRILLCVIAWVLQRLTQQTAMPYSNVLLAASAMNLQISMWILNTSGAKKLFNIFIKNMAAIVQRSLLSSLRIAHAVCYAIRGARLGLMRTSLIRLLKRTVRGMESKI